MLLNNFPQIGHVCKFETYALANACVFVKPPNLHIEICIPPPFPHQGDTITRRELWPWFDQEGNALVVRAVLL